MDKGAMLGMEQNIGRYLIKVRNRLQNKIISFQD